MAGARRRSCSGARPSIDTTRCSDASELHSRGMGRTALVTNCTSTPMRSSSGSSRSKFAIPDQRFSPDDREMHRAQAPYYRQRGIHQVFSAIVGKLPQGGYRAKVVRRIRVAAGTVKRALLGNLDRQKRRIPSEYARPYAQNVRFLHEGPLSEFTTSFSLSSLDGARRPQFHPARAPDVRPATQPHPTFRWNLQTCAAHLLGNGLVRENPVIIRSNPTFLRQLPGPKRTAGGRARPAAIRRSADGCSGADCPPEARISRTRRLTKISRPGRLRGRSRSASSA